MKVLFINLFYLVVLVCNLYGYYVLGIDGLVIGGVLFGIYFLYSILIELVEINRKLKDRLED